MSVKGAASRSAAFTGAVADRVLVVGDLNPDLILRGDVVPRFGQAEQLLDSADLVIGGSAGITAHGFARLGRPVTLVAAVGADDFGETMTTALVTAGVDINQLIVRDGESTGLSVHLSAANDRAILTLPGAIPTLTVGEVSAAVDAVSGSQLRHVHLCALFLQPQLLNGLAELLAGIRSTGVSISLDTNGDPADNWNGVDELLPEVDVLLPNRAEALAMSHAITGEQAEDLVVACQSLAARGPLVVAKDGLAGAVAVDESGELGRASSRPAEAIDTTGAGDTFNVAFLDAWLGDVPLTECLRRGAVAGAFSVTGLGGTATQPTLDLLLDSGRTP